MRNREHVYGAIEAGGTKFICAVAHGVEWIVEERRIETTLPDATLAEVVDFFATAQKEYGALRGFGIASFGPLQLDRKAANWGQLLATPKPGWSFFNLVSVLRGCIECPIEVDTDVNAAALAESVLGAQRGHGTLAYVTVGTGIGAGVVIDGRTLRGWMHPEMGHIYVRRDPRDAAFGGVCRFHGDCLEGLASGVAVQRRWQAELSALPDDHIAYGMIGGYLGQLAATMALMLSPERIVFGGGVMSNGLLLPHIRGAMRDTLAGYIPAREPDGAAEQTVCVSSLQGRSGLLGALLLATRAGANEPQSRMT